MLNKNIQQYSNECGKYAILNLLSLYNLEDKIEIDFKINGTSLSSMEKCLSKYFNKVVAVKLDITTLIKFKPFILLLEKENSNHYVVVYKRKHNYFYILDSSSYFSYKISLEKLSKITSFKALIVEDKNEKYEKNKKINSFSLFLLSFIETSSILALAITLGDIIDNELENGIIYLLLEIVILLVTFVKIKMFLKDFKIIDKTIRNKTLTNIYNLDSKYVNNHYINEIYYRLFDDYTRKSILLTILYSFINDSILILLTLLILFLYSKTVFLLFVLVVIPIIIFMFFVSKKMCILLETKRKAELEFYAYYKDSFNHRDDIYINNNKEYENKSYKLLKEYQESDYKLEKYNNFKNYLLLSFQSILISSLLIIYFVYLKDSISVGSLVTIISLISSVLSPLLNICSRITDFSNYKLLNKRIDELKENKKSN